MTDCFSDFAVIDLYDGIYASCISKTADFFDMVPVLVLFSRAETDSGNLAVKNVDTINRKQYLKLVRNSLLFLNVSGLLFHPLSFILGYLPVKFLTSKFYIQTKLSELYKKPLEMRERRLSIDLPIDVSQRKPHRFSIVTALILIAVLGGIIYWAMTSEPDVVLSTDCRSVVCFDEVFMRYDEGIPENAKEVWLENYSVYYILSNGEYDMDNYYCYIYEDTEGERYMWVKTGCSKEENADKDYDDYQNPWVYKSIGENAE